MDTIDYMLEVRIKDYSRDVVLYDVTDLTTGKVLGQNFPDWIYRYSKEYVNKHTRFILPPWEKGPVGEFWIGWTEWERNPRGRVYYTPTIGEDIFYNATNS